jgi:hypothetical protein
MKKREMRWWVLLCNCESKPPLDRNEGREDDTADVMHARCDTFFRSG